MKKALQAIIVMMVAGFFFLRSSGKIQASTFDCGIAASPSSPFEWQPFDVSFHLDAANPPCSNMPDCVQMIYCPTGLLPIDGNGCLSGYQGYTVNGSAVDQA